MEVNLAYGKKGLRVDLPERAKVIEPIHVEALKNLHEAVLNSLRHPNGTKPLKEMVKSTEKVVIVITSTPRQKLYHDLVPWLIEELSHVPLENITIINATAARRDQTKKELIEILGREVVDKVRIINHHCQDKSELVHVGKSRYGCEVYLNKEYVQADFRMVIGPIEPHFLLGFSGGPQGVMPGIAGFETILTFYMPKIVGHSLAMWGILNRNPLQEMSREVNIFCKPNFILNVAVNEKNEITNVFAGDLAIAHLTGCAYVKEHTMMKYDQRFDVVITTNSGYPFDRNLYQTVEAIDAAQKIVKQGGTIICAAECSEGLSEEDNFANLLNRCQTPKELLKMIEEPSFVKMIDQWQVQKLAMSQEWADVCMYSTLSDESLGTAKLTPVRDVKQALDKLAGKYGSEMSIAVLPLGPRVIPYVDEPELY